MNCQHVYYSKIKGKIPDLFFCGTAFMKYKEFPNLCPLQQEYVLQPDGTVVPLNNVQNYVLSEQQAGEILAQVL